MVKLCHVTRVYPLGACGECMCQKVVVARKKRMCIYTCTCASMCARCVCVCVHVCVCVGCRCVCVVCESGGGWMGQSAQALLLVSYFPPTTIIPGTASKFSGEVK